MSDEIVQEAETIQAPAFNEKRLKRRLKTMGWGLFWMMVAAQFLAFIPLLLANYLVESGYLNPTLGQWLAVDVSIYGIGLPLFYLTIRNLPKFTIEDKRYPFNLKKVIHTAIVLFGILYLFNIIAFGITTGISLLTGREVTDIISSTIDSSASIYTFIFVVIIAPIMEELIFRKLIIDRTIDLGETYAIIFSAVSFGLFHGNLNQTLYATMLGIGLAYIYIKSGNIKYAILFHMIVNFFGSFLMPLLLSINESLSILCFAFIFISILISIFTFVKHRKDIQLNEGDIPLPLKKKLKYGMCNAGYIIYMVVFILLILYFLFLY